MIVVHFKLINENNVFIEPKVGISDYDLDEDDIRVKYKNFDYILCEKCNKKESDIIEKKRMEFGKCKECLKIHKNMDVRKYGLLEWIPYDKFTNIEFIGKRGLAKVYPAIWIDESIIKVESIL
ncbi:kinase-like domain-containing protein [Rhizophagus irregularis DAOM 181602=DAOM 197198]|uniref:Uncharacterized protein n=1 Tax=Rhizophagus irregularis (strain DAOM 181602 / DAOM 197198 / MUCL 43194) TaxID=747089 RepID=U9UBB2_RHIID|nr:kinase-like domain-containing protein [Rhizophagus irregularis DAOM 181602=DAOM 197198]